MPVERNAFAERWAPRGRFAFCCVTADFDFGVLVALADGPAFALLEVGGPPWDIDVVQGHGAGLHVGAGAHFFGRSDEHRDLAAVALVEQLQSFVGGAGIVDEPYRRGSP